MQAIATACALGSGVGMAMVNLVFGQFITVITDYTTGKSTAADFRSDAARLAYVALNEQLSSRDESKTDIGTDFTFSSSVSAALLSATVTARSTPSPPTASPVTFATSMSRPVSAKKSPTLMVARADPLPFRPLQTAS